MKATKLTKGDQFTIRPSKKYENIVGKTVTVVDNNVIADGLPNQRCITVQVDDTGEIIHILPRLLDDGSIRISTQQGATATAAAVAPVPVERNPIVDPMDPRLDPFRPNANVVKEYVNRTLIGGVKDTELLMHYWETRDNNGYSQNVMLVGDTQSGKTMLIRVMAVLIAKKMGFPKPLPIFTLSGSAGVTDYDLLGQPTAYTDENGVERIVWLPGLVELASRVACILYLDEIAMMPERVTSTLHPVTDDRRTFCNRAKAVCKDGEFLPEETKVNTGCWVVGTYNAGYRGSGSLNEAFQNRFRHLPWDYDDSVEKRLVSSETVLLLGKALRDARNLRTLSTPVGTKALVRLWEDAQTLNVDLALWAFTGMFPPSERPKVEAIITDRSIKVLLEEEVENLRTGAAIAAASTVQFDEAELDLPF